MILSCVVCTRVAMQRVRNRDYTSVVALGAGANNTARQKGQGHGPHILLYSLEVLQDKLYAFI